MLNKSVSSLLGKLLHEELALRWDQLLLDEAFTGGALAWVPGRTARVGQLVYPAGGALDKLCILLLGGGQPPPCGEGGAPGVVRCRVGATWGLAVSAHWSLAEAQPSRRPV